MRCLENSLYTRTMMITPEKSRIQVILISVSLSTEESVSREEFVSLQGRTLIPLYSPDFKGYPYNA